MANTIQTPFTATATANFVVKANPMRRGMKIQVYGPPDVSPGITVWMRSDGNSAVSFQGWQCGPGAVWEWGVLDTKEFSHPPSKYAPNCPTGPISVITAGGTQQGIIEELI